MPKSPTKTPAPKSPSLKLTEFTPAAIADTITAVGAKKTGKLLHVPTENIVTMPGFNIRIDNEAYRAGIDELAASIEMEGYYDSHPLSCFAATIDGEPRVVIIDGHRRKAAIDLLIAAGGDYPTIPVVLKKPTVTDLDLAISLEKENNAVPLTVLERAVLARRLLKSGMERSEVAERLGKSERHIGDLVILIESPRAIRDLVRDGKIPAYEAIAKLKTPGGVDKIIELVEKAEKRAAEKGEKVSRLSRSAINNDGVKPPRLAVHRFNFKAEAGATFMYEDVEPFLNLIGDEDWFKPARKKAERISLIDLSVDVSIRRPKVDAEDEPQETSNVTMLREMTGEDEAPARYEAEDTEEDDGDAPDLRELDIADPADAGL